MLRVYYDAAVTTSTSLFNGAANVDIERGTPPAEHLVSLRPALHRPLRDELPAGRSLVNGALVYDTAPTISGGLFSLPSTDLYFNLGHG